jgi:hypothetical protein
VKANIGVTLTRPQAESVPASGEVPRSHASLATWSGYLRITKIPPHINITRPRPRPSLGRKTRTSKEKPASRLAQVVAGSRGQIRRRRGPAGWPGRGARPVWWDPFGPPQIPARGGVSIWMRGGRRRDGLLLAGLDGRGGGPGRPLRARPHARLR